MAEKRNIAAVIVAGGSGTRAGGELPKQYQMIGGRPVIAWSIEAFQTHPAISHVVAVIGDGHEALFNEAAAGLKQVTVVIGGSSRQASCYEGIRACEGFAPSHILIHDAARPFISHGLITAIISASDADTGSIPGVPVTDTLKRTSLGIIDATVKRDQLWSVQTPQCFPYSAIAAAHKRARDEGLEGLTDDAAVAEHAGIKVRVVMGDPRNRKITTAQDVTSARAELERHSFAARPDVRTGQGIDFHVFEKGDHVILGGVHIPHTQKLKGHSDADCVLHAMTDALLGSMGEQDIGKHFPPSDKQWKNADSRIFVEKAMSLLKARDGVVANADITILAEEPKINPHVSAMKSVIASLCGISPDRVAVKATTTETMGAIGRKEGIAAFATVTIRLPA